MNQQEAVKISKALKKVTVQRERQEIIQAAVLAGLTEVPEIDTAMEPVTLTTQNFGEASGRELAMILQLFLTEKGYYEEGKQWS